MPDLTFSEMKFLQRPHSGKENLCSAKLAKEPPERNGQHSKGYEATSAFLPDDQHVPSKFFSSAERDMHRDARKAANGKDRDHCRCYTGQNEIGESGSQNKLRSEGQATSQNCPKESDTRSATAITCSSSAKTCESKPNATHKTAVENNGPNEIEAIQEASYDSSSGARTDQKIIRNKFPGANDKALLLQDGKHLQGNSRIDEQDQLPGAGCKTTLIPSSERCHGQEPPVQNGRCHATFSQLLESCESALNRAGRHPIPRAIDPVWYGEKEIFYQWYTLQWPKVQLENTTCEESEEDHWQNQSDLPTTHIPMQSTGEPRVVGNKTGNHQYKDSPSLFENEGLLSRSDSAPLRPASHCMQGTWCREDPTSLYRREEPFDVQASDGRITAPQISHPNGHHDDCDPSYAIYRLADLQRLHSHARLVHRNIPSHEYYACSPELQHEPCCPPSMGMSPQRMETSEWQHEPFMREDYDLGAGAIDDREEGPIKVECGAELVMRRDFWRPHHLY